MRWPLVKDMFALTLVEATCQRYVELTLADQGLIKGSRSILFLARLLELMECACRHGVSSELNSLTFGLHTGMTALLFYTTQLLQSTVRCMYEAVLVALHDMCLGYEQALARLWRSWCPA